MVKMRWMRSKTWLASLFFNERPVAREYQIGVNLSDWPHFCWMFHRGLTYSYGVYGGY